MSKMRVYEVAKKFNLNTKDLIEKLKEMNVVVNSHMSMLEQPEVDLITGYYDKKADKKEVVQKDMKQSESKIKENKKNHNVQAIEIILEDDQNSNVEGLNMEDEEVLLYEEYKEKQEEIDSKGKKVEIKKEHDKHEHHEHHKKEEVKHDKKEEIKKEEPQKQVGDEIKVIEIPENITVKDLATKLNKAPAEIIKFLMLNGVVANINQNIEFDAASKVAERFNIIIEKETEKDIEDIIFEEEDTIEELKERPPIVVVMGHVDHGKTSLLDAIRKTSVTTTEHGGITQHIGAYEVQKNGKKITFLDTPGHEAFTAMRLRGAKVTDIAILVVAADDGVMPQTVEAIDHAKAANLQIIVAINKIDKPGANPDKVKQELTEYGLVSEDWGGDTIFVEVSAIQKTGIDELLEMILLVSEMLELKADYKKRAKGTVIEAKLDKGRGPVATILVQDGNLKVGDPILAGKTFGKVRAMHDSKGKKIKLAGPSVPVEILGFSEVPQAGETVYVTKSDKQAKQLAQEAIAVGREKLLEGTKKISLDGLFDQIKAGNIKDLNIIIKADVQGSVEAMKQSMNKLSNEEVRVRIVHAGAGAITESDVMLASASNGIIIGFNVRPEPSARSIADNENVDLRFYTVIYNALEDVEAAMKGMLDPEYKEKVTGYIEVRQIFKISSVGTIAGGYVKDGKMQRNGKARVIREGIVLFEGEIASLKRFKDDVKEVAEGYECGVMLEKFNDIREGDIIEAFIMEEIKR